LFSSPKTLRRYLNIHNVSLLVLALLIGLLWYYLESVKQEGNYPNYLVAILWVLILMFVLWLGNLWISRLVGLRYSWERSFKFRFPLQLITTLFFSLVCINISYILFKNHFTELPPTQDQLLLLNIYGALFLIPVASIQFGLLFLYKWKRAVIEQERLRREQVQSELLTLRSHLSPHFLFNTLNILSSLIHPDNHRATDYLDSFAEVYRYVLKNGEVELIALREELQFLEAYAHLLNQRFTDSLQIEINVESSLNDLKIPPLAMQMVLENALKHTTLSVSQPLRVKISSIDMPAITVQNTLMPREVPDHEKTG
jgi:sensor histidine kinase YesM